MCGPQMVVQILGSPGTIQDGFRVALYSEFYAISWYWSSPTVTLNQRIKGSSPLSPTNKLNDLQSTERRAQSVQHPHNTHDVIAFLHLRGESTRIGQDAHMCGSLWGHQREPQSDRTVWAASRDVIGPVMMPSRIKRSIRSWYQDQEVHIANGARLSKSVSWPRRM
jgi:hypothetical protein